MGWFGPQSGSCGCCTPAFVCDDCAALTYFTISGLNNADCNSGCNGRNGTYIFRTVGSYDEVPGEDPVCLWRIFWGNNNCGDFDGNAYYIGSYPSGSGGSYPAHCSDAIHGPTISFRYVGGNVEITVEIYMPYTYKDSFGTPLQQSGYLGIWRGTFASCADAVGETLTFDSGDSVVTDCPVGATGDVCNLLGATITLG